MAVLTVVCVKAKPNYDHRYVNRLHRMVEEHLTIPHRFVCFTDDASGIKCPTKGIPHWLSGTGWWAKMAIFKPYVLEGQVLYLDLDTLILDNIDFVADYKGDFAILEDFYRPEGYGSGVMLWNKQPFHVWEEWIRALKPNHPLGDQGWIEEQIPNADLLQAVFPHKFISYKVHCDLGVPEGAAVLSFHGLPKPHDFSKDHWVTKTWLGEKELA